MHLPRTKSKNGQAPVRTVQWLNVRKVGGMWGKDIKLEILKMQFGLSVIRWQYISYVFFSGQKLGNYILLLPCQKYSAYILNSVNELNSLEI